MPRPKRTDDAGAWHHVMNRGAGKRDIFFDERDRDLFLSALADANDKIEIHAYCLMTNHYHLLVRSISGDLSAAMQHVAGRFTRLFNLRRTTDGALFRGRFTSVRLGSDQQIQQTVRYIHLNPVVARLIAKPESWFWSSAAAYKQASCKPDWLHLNYVLATFGDVDPTSRYSVYLAEGIDLATAEFYARFD
jgi:putative transposase